MYPTNEDHDKSFEVFPGGSKEKGEVSKERLEEAERWEATMKDAEPFAGNQFGVANEANSYYGESTDNEEINDEEYDKGIADAAAIINHGLEAAARKYGVEMIVQKIKGFDTSGSEDPIGDFFRYLDIDTPIEKKQLRDEEEATKSSRNQFRDNINAPRTINKSIVGAVEAINNMKELILEVEGADSKYEELRDGAKTAGKGVFEYAVSALDTQGLTGLFSVLAKQREKNNDGNDVVANEDDGRLDVAMTQAQGENGEEKNNSEEKHMRLEEKIKNQEKLNPEILH